MASYKHLYTAAGVNKASAVASSCSVSGLVAFGAGCQLCLWDSDDPHSAGVHTVLPGHQADISAVQLVQQQQEGLDSAARTLVSGDAAGVLKLWRRNDTTQQWDCVTSVQAHQGSLSALTIVHHPSTQSLCIVTGGSDATLQVFQYALEEENAQCRPVQTLSTGTKLPLGLAATRSSSHDIILALAATERKISIYTCAGATAELQFTHSVALEGHADWVRSLSFSPILPHTGDLFLASGGQDNYIRLWRFRTLAEGAVPPQLDELDLLDEHSDDVAMRAKFFTPRHSNRHHSVEPESVLLGHEAWAVSLHWSPILFEDDLPKLASASADRSLIIWSYSPATSLWLNEYRLGELGGPAGLGFFGALWGKQCQSIMVHDWSGSLHIWRRAPSANVWSAGVGLSGHFKETMDIEWQAQGKWLLSASLDKTTRLHAPWKRQDPSSDKQLQTWHELSRPQIHGHDLYALAITDKDQGLRFTSGADETIVRVFDATKTFVGLANRLSSSELQDSGDRPNAAIVPPLGLSNRAVSADEKPAEPEEGLPLPLTIVEHERPPTEEALLSTTLWPEVDKLYGHGYEIRTMAGSHDGQYLASACRATNAFHAAVHLRTTNNMKRIGEPLADHTLSIHRIAFSPDDRYILTVGRDRSWHVYRKAEEGVQPYTAFAHDEKAHSRLVYDGCWLDDATFATAARDKTVKVWRQNDGATGWAQAECLTLKEPPTALASTKLNGTVYLAIGTESGAIMLYAVRSSSQGSLELQEQSKIPLSLAHGKQVTRLAFAPHDSQDPTSALLASCSEDRLVRVLQVSLA